MGSGKVSAIPGELTSWSGWAQRLNDDMQRAGRSIDAAIEEFNDTLPDPAVIGTVPDLGADLVGYAVRNNSTDAWVGRVGEAFFRAETKNVPPQILRTITPRSLAISDSGL